MLAESDLSDSAIAVDLDLEDMAASCTVVETPENMVVGAVI